MSNLKYNLYIHGISFDGTYDNAIIESEQDTATTYRYSNWIHLFNFTYKVPFALRYRSVLGWF